MARIITLKYPAICKDCGASLQAGTRAKYYNARHIYGLDCHRSGNPNHTRTAYEQGDQSKGAIYSHYDRTGIYSHDGRKLGSSCNCEDYPCCGH